MRNLTEADYEKIITDYFVFGKKQAAIAEELGGNSQIVSIVVNGFRAVKDADWDYVIKKIGANQSIKIYAWAAGRIGTTLPPEVIYAYEKRRMLASAKYKKAQEKKKLPPATPEKPTVQEKNETVYFCRLLEEIARQNELLEQLMDVVIPKYVSDLKDNQNANFDAQTAEIKKSLDQIAANTRKRGL